MKDKLLVTLLFIAPFFAFGQSIKDAENFTMGTVLKFQECDTNVQPGLTGAKETWDFSMVRPDGGIITETMVAPETTPDGKQYPKANMVEKRSDGSYIYTDKEALLSYLVGYTSATVQMQYPKPVAFIKRPVNLGGTNSYPFTDKMTAGNLSFSGSGTVNISADGTGTLITPDKKKYSNVLRVKVTQKQRDTLLQYKTVSPTTIVTYAWFDDKHKSAIFKMTTVTSPSYVKKNVEYLLSEEDK